MPRQERRRTVTLIAGMVCKDGIVMAADSEQSGFYRKSNVPKLESTQPGPKKIGCSVIVAGAGNGELADYASHRIMRQVRPLQKMSEAEAKLEEILANIFGQKMPVYKTEDLGEFRLLIALKAPDRDNPRLYSTYGSTLVERKKFVLGSGSLVDYVLDQIYDGEMLSEDGVVAALSLLQIAKKYVDGVGGDSKIAVLDQTGRVRQKPAWEITSEESILAEHSQLANKLMLAMMRTRSDSDLEWTKHLSSFTQSIGELRGKKKDSDKVLEEMWEKFQAAMTQQKEEEEREESKKLPYVISIPATNLFKQEGNVFTGKSVPNAKLVAKLPFKSA